MDTGSLGGLSASENANWPDALKKLNTDPSQHNCHFMDKLFVNALGNSLTDVLHIQDDQKLPSEAMLCGPSEKTDYPSVEIKEECEDPNLTESTIVTLEESLSKCAIFPCPGKKSSVEVSIYGEHEVTAAVSNQIGCESVMPAYPQSIPLPSALKLVSAMKGGREKQGAPPKKLTVTWAPDVYDPLPSAPTLVRINKPRYKNEQKKKHDKRNGKNKQKGKPSRAGGSKDKKQVRKYCDSSSKCYYQSLSNDNRVVDCNEPRGEFGDFAVCSPDVYCGSSFLKKSINTMHFSIAEAT